MHGQLFLLISSTLLCLCPLRAHSLQVEITTSSVGAIAGELYTLTCTVTGVTSDNLTVEWTGQELGSGSGGGIKMDITVGAATTAGNATTLNLTFDPLQDSQDGNYTCIATVMTDTAMSTTTLNVIAPEVTVTVSATGESIAGGTGYSLTCVHDAPSSLMATVQSTLTTPDGTMITSLPHTFNPLLVTDGGQYSCTATVNSPYLTDDFTATPGPPLNVTIETLTPSTSMLMPMDMTESLVISTQVVFTAVPTPSIPCDSMDLLLPDCDMVSPSLHHTTPTPTEFASGFGSGSGMDSIFPDFSSTPQLHPTAVPSPSPTPFDFILVTFMVPVADYRTIEENFTALVKEVLLEGNLTAELVIAVDDDQSNGTHTIVMLYLVSESGEADNIATLEAYQILNTSTNPQWVKFQEDNNIEINFQMNTSDVPPPTSTPSRFDLPLWQWVVIGVSGGILISAWTVLCCCCWCRCRNLHRKRREEKEKSRQLDWDVRDYWDRGEIEMNTTTSTERQAMVRKVSRISFRSRAQVKSYPLTVDELEQLLGNIPTLHAQYSSIPSNMITMAEVPPGAEDKNRYKDVLPNPHSRVALFLKFGVPNSDYINANYITGYTGVGKAYIATQGPLYWTITDFWRMVWEQKSSVIIMTTGLEERGMAKCARYWPDEKVSPSSVYEDLEVTVRRRMTTKDYAVTYFRIRHIEKMVSREVTHFWFTSWPDHGVPHTTQSVMDFLLHIKKYIRDTPGPAVVHCSAGIGRTGVFIGADIGMRQLEETGEVDILKIVSTMRLDRGGMVQTKDQFVFLHQVLLEYAHHLEQLKGASSRTAAPHRLETTLEEDEYDSDDSQKILVQN